MIDRAAPHAAGPALQVDPEAAGAGEALPDECCTVIAAYNEEASIGTVVRRLRTLQACVVVVDDGSSDATAERAHEAGAAVLRHAINRGQGAALQTGITHALGAGAQVIVTFDADGQHVESDLPRLVAPVLAGEADVALGSRFLGQADSMPPTRRRVLRLAVAFTRLMSGVRLSDTHNGLRALSRAAAEKLDIRRDRMAHASEIIDAFTRSGMRVVEVPVRIRYTPYSRTKGQRSSHAIRIAMDYLLGRLLD